MRIYTKTGDEGMTGLFGGGRVGKENIRIAAYGDIDELNAVLGMAKTETQHAIIIKTLTEIQNHLFTIGSQLATPLGHPNVEVITSSEVDSLERQIDVMSENLPPMRNFILPGGSRVAAVLHFARTVCRRAERMAVQLSKTPGEPVDKWVLIYLNRLSDYLFVLARLSNQLEKIEDIPWFGGKKK